MRLDAYNLSTSTVSSEAETAFEAAVHALAAHSPNTGVALQSTLAADPDHVAALALKGFANLILARSELVAPAADALAAAGKPWPTVMAEPGTNRFWCMRFRQPWTVRSRRPAQRLDEGFAERPATFLPFKLSHALRFMLGDANGMLSASNRSWKSGAKTCRPPASCLAAMPSRWRSMDIRGGRSGRAARCLPATR